MNKDNLTTLFRYKRWADAETLAAISRVEENYKEKRHLMLRLMNHIYVVDRIFTANLSGQAHGYTALNTPETPDCATLKAAMADATEGFIDYITALPETTLMDTVHFRFVDGGAGEMKIIDMLNHVLFHGAYHRGAVGWLLSEAKQTPPKDVMTVFLRDHN